MECPYRGDPLIQVLQVNSCGDFQPIDLKYLFEVLEGSVEGMAVLFGDKKDKKDIVKEYSSLKVIDDEQIIL